MIDLKKIQSELSDERIVELVYSLGATEHIDKKDHIEFRTICHHENEEDGKHKLYYYKNTKMFVCYSCCGAFNIFGLFTRRYETIGKEYNFFKDVVKVIQGNKKSELVEGFDNKYESDYDNLVNNKITVNIPHLSPTILNIYSNYFTDEWRAEDISEESMRIYGIKYSIPENKIIIPHYDDKGYLVGIRGRNLNKEDLEFAKYMPVQIGEKIYSHPLGYNLYGLNLIKSNIKRKKVAIIFEAEKSVLKYDSLFGHENNISVAACGSSLHKYQIELLTKSGADSIIVAFDKEGENEKEKNKYFNKLKKICGKFKNYCNIGFIWDSKDLLGLKDSPIDCGKEVFIELIKGVNWV